MGHLQFHKDSRVNHGPHIWELPDKTFYPVALEGNYWELLYYRFVHLMASCFGVDVTEVSNGT